MKFLIHVYVKHYHLYGLDCRHNLISVCILCNCGYLSFLNCLQCVVLFAEVNAVDWMNSLADIYCRIFSHLQNLWVQKAIYFLHGWHNNGFWNWAIWSWSLSDCHRGIFSLYAKILVDGIMFLFNVLVEGITVIYFLSSGSIIFRDPTSYFYSFVVFTLEYGSCHARKWNWFVPRCWICLHSSTESRRWISWYAFWSSSSAHVICIVWLF